ncbi:MULTISPECIES: class I SAM-dependent methyltransferase [unclassified Bradyrhizobium]|uniref:class I SAM-dependent methyltransferase n=1 Tax=unclassified Bradyrhizobium TaxID=2631580 RepID=UPI0024797CF1|nr:MULTISPECIES: class I SAM-dependent methyltransferase [unclassified Bradyrhizobium]WGS21093.1 class I SAM-dependent methyltransferase [Bradyrhizobium sp. ISRA463]WGS28010.1 class I SAM-dependent methyltransferase [Bradyrhizobium sp. ISRA464]
MDVQTQSKWDRASRTYDFFSAVDDRRLGSEKRKLLSKARGKTLHVAAGTGNDFKFLPPRADIVSIDISPKMLERAKLKAASYEGSIELREADVCNLDYPEATFDTVVTVFTFCSVPKPIAGLRELYRVLKPGGQILMLEHVRSAAIGPLGVMMDLMTQLTRKIGPELNRDTVGNVQKAGFRLRRVENIYLDVVKTIEAVKDRA